ncbi:Protein of unknown function [Gryllus bimaculatus]|nr:Protein of unknown function [Gryllus bimaculatus]
MEPLEPFTWCHLPFTWRHLPFTSRHLSPSDRHLQPTLTAREKRFVNHSGTDGGGQSGASLRTSMLVVAGQRDYATRRR